MARRSSWEGFLKLSLISVPVRAYNAAQPGGGDIHFHQIHKDCGSRIRYQKVCPIHGEVTKEEIVSGYEYEKGQYLEFEPGEITKMRAEQDQSINIEHFTGMEEIDPLYLSGKTYFLVPDGPAGQKPYALLHKVMKQKNCQALARVVLSGHEETVLVRPLEKLLAMTVLYNENEIKKPETFHDELDEPKVSAQEEKLAGHLVDAATTDEAGFTPQQDHYTERVTQLIEAKLSGQKPRAAEKAKAPRVINLMDALRQSLDQTQAEAKKKGGQPAVSSRGQRRTSKRKTG